MPALAAALSGPGGDPRAELAAIVGDAYDALARNRVGIKLVDRSARDIPELGRLWFGGARSFLVDALATYLRARVDAGLVRAPRDVDIAARFVVETCAFWAVHRHWDAAPQALAEPEVRAATIDLVVTALTSPPEEPKKTTKTTTKERGKP
jgi:hypothetical protein